MRQDYEFVISADAVALASGHAWRGVARLGRRARALAASDHLALRLAGSAVLGGGLALAVWWAVGAAATL